MRYPLYVVAVMIFMLAPCPRVSAAHALTLQEALERVAGNGRDVRMARAAWGTAQAQAAAARAPLFPQVSAGVSRNYYAYQPASILGGSKIFTAEKSFFAYGVNVHQTLFDFGASQARHQAAMAQARAAQDDAVYVRNRAALELVGVYFDVLEAQRMIGVAREQLSSLARHARDVTVLYREGVVTRNELLAVKVRFNEARQKLVAARNGQRTATARLRELLLLPDQEPLALEDPQVSARPGVTLKKAQEFAMLSRPELRAMDKAVQAAEWHEEFFRASDRPSLFADGAYTRMDNRYQARDDNWQGQVGVKISVFNGGLTRAEIDSARQDKERVLEERRKLVDQIRFEVETAMLDMDNATERMVLARSGASQAQENVRVTAARYREGAGTSSDVLDAVALRAGAETELWRGTYELKRSYARWLNATGTDLAAGYLTREAVHEISE